MTKTIDIIHQSVAEPSPTMACGDSKKVFSFILISGILCLVNCNDCPFSSCDIFRFLSEFKSDSTKLNGNNEISEKMKLFVSMERIVNDIDRRLRSVEQPCM